MSPQIVVTSIENSIEFYTSKLGFDLAFHQDFYAGLIKDRHSIHLKVGNPSIEARKTKRENNDLDIVFSIDNVEDLYEEFLNKSVEITQPLCVQPYGREFYVADPDGYILAFLEEV